MIQGGDIKRSNDDFYLNFDGSNYLSLNDSLSFINKDSDFSISFFIVPDSQTTDRYVISCRNGIGGDGWSVRYHDDRLKFQTDIGGFTQYSFNHSFNVNSINHVFLNYDSTTRDMNCYVDSVLIGTENIANLEFTNLGTETYFGARDNVNTSLSFEGGIRDFVTFDKILTQEEINYIYYNGVLPVSSYSNVQQYYPLNQIPYESGGNYFFEDKASLYNSSATTFDLQAFGWTGTELGIPTNTTATTYRDFNDKTNVIPPVGYYKGLNFNSSNNNYIEVQGLDTFSKDEGYTFLIGVEKTFDSGQQSIFSCVGDEGFSDYYDIFRRGGGNNNEYQFTSPQPGSQTSTSSNNLNNSIDVTEKNFISYLVSPIPTKIIKPYGGTVITKIIDVNCQQSYNSAFFDSSRYLTLGFNELTNPVFQIGARIGSNRLNGKIYFLSIIKRILTKEEEKEIYNNGFFKSPFEVIKDTDKIILDVDFQNPFDNGGQIEFPDNSGNCTLIANGTDWNTLTGVQNSID